MHEEHGLALLQRPRPDKGGVAENLAEHRDSAALGGVGMKVEQA